MEVTEELLKNIAEQTETLAGRKIIFFFVQGSQNYNLDTPASDVDCKAFVLPTFEDLYYGNQYSTTLDFDFGQVTVHDIRMLPDLLFKMNPTYVELFFAKYVYFPHPELKQALEKEIPELLDNAVFFDELFRICKYRFLASMIGTFNKKIKEMNSPTPSRKEVVEQYGYDIKSASHAIRYFRLLTLIVSFIREQIHARPYQIFASEIRLEDERARNMLLEIKLGQFDKATILDRLHHEKIYVKAIQDQYEELAKKPSEGSLGANLRRGIYRLVKSQLG